MTRFRPLPAGALLLLAACVPTLTPQQEWVMTKFEECRTKTGGWCMDEEWQRDPPKVAR